MAEGAALSGDPTYWRYRPLAPEPGTTLGPLEAIPDGGAREYRFGRGGSAFSMFVVRKGREVYGYLNICPHFSLPLNFRHDEFMHEGRGLIMCHTHFAIFEVATGRCLEGACEGLFLDPVPVEVVGDEIRIKP